MTEIVRIENQDEQVSNVEGLLRLCHGQAVEFVRGIPQSGGIKPKHGEAVDFAGDLDPIARGAGRWRDQTCFAFGQGVRKSAFPDIRRPDEGDTERRREMRYDRFGGEQSLALFADQRCVIRLQEAFDFHGPEGGLSEQPLNTRERQDRGQQNEGFRFDLICAEPERMFGMCRRRVLIDGARLSRTRGSRNFLLSYLRETGRLQQVETTTGDAAAAMKMQAQVQLRRCAVDRDEDIIEKLALGVE